MKVHFIAIGGAVMHNLAIALQNKGNKVTGSDDEIFEPSRSRLDRYGLLPEKWGWYPDKISSDIETVILGMHARPDNPELLRSLELGVRIMSFPEFLYNQTKNKKRIVIAGSHGKTTTTALLHDILLKDGRNAAVGGVLAFAHGQVPVGGRYLRPHQPIRIRFLRPAVFRAGGNVLGLRVGSTPQWAVCAQPWRE